MDEIYEVIIGERAIQQIDDIVIYIARNSSELAAEKVYNGINKAIDRLNRMPESHSRLRYMESENPVFRRINVWKYVIVFTVDEDSKIINIMDVSHSSQDPQRLIDRLEAP